MITGSVDSLTILFLRHFLTHLLSINNKRVSLSCRRPSSSHSRTPLPAQDQSILHIDRRFRPGVIVIGMRRECALRLGSISSRLLIGSNRPLRMNQECDNGKQKSGKQYPCLNYGWGVKWSMPQYTGFFRRLKFTHFYVTVAQV